jgi:2-polyprenyl-3-methyl-5-hydroxy-6-metoxy-1,4-benzoquinol methylase
MEIARDLRDITKKDAMDAYQELKEFSATEPDFSRVGLKTLDFFFLHHRIKAKTKGISFYEAVKDRTERQHLNELVIRYKKKALKEYDAIGLVKAEYQVFQLYYGSINQFRPTVAKWVYHTLQPKVGILDFSSGWGGRCLAAMSMGIPYIGIDANTKLEASYKKMIALDDSHVTMVFKPSEQVDFSKYRYDVVFTSPPYFMIERYERMPAYSSKQEFLDAFFIPVTMNAWKHLKRGGHMALNIPEEMYDAIKEVLPKIKTHLLLPLSNKHPTNASKVQRLGKEDKIRNEIIYVWQK